MPQRKEKSLCYCNNLETRASDHASIDEKKEKKGHFIDIVRDGWDEKGLASETTGI